MVARTDTTDGYEATTGSDDEVSNGRSTSCARLGVVGGDVTSSDARDADVDDEGKITFLWYRLLKQACILASWICLGLVVEIIGPTIPDLKDTIGISYEGISRGLVFKAIGLAVGSISGGFLHEIFYRQTDLIMAFGTILGAIGTVGIPWVRSLGGLASMLCLTGVYEGLLNTGGNTMTMHLWGKHAAPPMHSVHLGFGIGAFLAPQIARPFFSSNSSAVVTYGNTSFSNDTTELTILLNNNMSTFKEARLVYPFTIIAVITTMLALCLCIFYIVGPPRGFPVRTPTTNLRKLLSPGSCSGGNTLFSTALLVFLFVYFIQAVGGERAYGKFLFSYAIDADVEFSKDDAAMLSSVFWGCHLTGRFLGIFITSFIKVQYVIVGSIVGGLITSVLLSIFSFEIATALWVLSAFMGFFVSLLFPCGMSWANLYLEMNAMATMVLLVGSAVGGLIYQYIPGYLFDLYGVRSLMYVMITYSLGSLLVFAIMQGIAHTKGNRFDRIYNLKEKNQKEQEMIVI